MTSAKAIQSKVVKFQNQYVMRQAGSEARLRE